jgi:hypothetical protein
VRWDFAHELHEVTEALRPQRLVVFLDDLDRCRPEQVVQILEAVNFLSLAAPCFIVLGADYQKVETLVGMQFEQIAKQETENQEQETFGSELKGTVDSIHARVAYARNYMRKVVNMRLDLPKPTDYGKFLSRDDAEGGRVGSMIWMQRAVLVGVAVLFVFGMGATDHWFGMPWSETSEQLENNPIVQPGPTPTEGLTAGPSQNKGASGKPEIRNNPPNEPEPTTAQFDRNSVGARPLHQFIGYLGGGVALVFLLLLAKVLGRPKEQEEARDTQDFLAALQQMTPTILRKHKTPRELRRFQNYVRFLAAADDSDRRVSIPNFAGQLVRIAAMGTKDGRMPVDIDSRVVEFYKSECQMLGLDPSSFRPIGDIE